jgi:hypothetical protein
MSTPGVSHTHYAENIAHKLEVGLKTALIKATTGTWRYMDQLTMLSTNRNSSLMFKIYVGYIANSVSSTGRQSIGMATYGPLCSATMPVIDRVCG